MQKTQLQASSEPCYDLQFSFCDRRPDGFKAAYIKDKIPNNMPTPYKTMQLKPI